MKIHLDPHTLERAEERGTNEKEILEVINTGEPVPGKYGRSGKAKTFPFAQNRLGKYYEQKRVEVFYVTGKDIIYSVTVYVFFGKWEDG